jgi:cytochrome c oxidase accessory protein FixG
VTKHYENEKYYRGKRYWLYLIVTAFTLSLPWITIDGNHMFLLSFDHKQLHLAGVAFDMQELYLMPFILMILFLGIFFLTTLGGRVWCGWACPQTIFRVIYRDFLETKLLSIRKRINNKQEKPVGKYGLKAIAILIWTILSLIAAANFVWFFVPPEDFISYLQDPLEHKVLLVFWLGLAVFLIYDVIMLKEDFCVYICPYARVQSVMYDEDTVMTIYDEQRGGKIFEGENKLHKKPIGETDECTGCESCVKVCPTHIDIRQGLQLECINCLECADACTKVMGALGKPSLISWTSDRENERRGKTKFMRFRTIAYGIALTLVTIGLFMMSTKKEHMLLNINKTTQLYSIQENGVVQNSYIFLFQNIDNKNHEYYFEVVSHPEIKIIRPSESVRLNAGKKAKKVVLLQTSETIVKDETKDTPIAIKIRAYAIDDKNIFVERDTVFTYPRWDVLQAKSK